MHSGHIQSTHYSSKSEDKIIYTDMAAILDFSFYSGYLLYSTSNLFWISSYMYLCLISTHELLLSAAIIFWQFLKICMWIFLNLWN